MLPGTRTLVPDPLQARLAPVKGPFSAAFNSEFQFNVSFSLNEKDTEEYSKSFAAYFLTSLFVHSEVKEKSVCIEASRAKKKYMKCSFFIVQDI